MSAVHHTLAVGIRTFASDQRADWAGMCAAPVVILVPAPIVFLLVQRHLVTGLTAGGTRA
jgi:arabinogalactan oligomer/maltooligosaccharide transport system permease protein